MDDDDNFGGFSSSDDDPVKEDEMPKAMPEEKIKKKVAVEIKKSAETIDENLELVKEVLESKAAISLPMTGATEAWMEEDLGNIESDEDISEQNYSSMELRRRIEAIENKENQSLQLLNISENWMDDVATTIETNDKDDKQVDKNLNRNTSMKKLSAFEQAQQFSVDEDDTICSIEDVEYDNLESTSWAYVASQKIETKEDCISEHINQQKTKVYSNPALIVEIIEKEPKVDIIDDEGYQIFTKKSKDTVNKSGKVASFEEVLRELDQPIEDKIMSSETEEFVLLDSKETDNREEDIHENITEEDVSNYTLEVSVKTKETLLGKKLHQNDEKDWKMDVQCVQKDIIPDIIEGYDKRTEEEKTHTEAGADLCLSPAWMRKKDYKINTPITMEKIFNAETAAAKTEIVHKSQDEDDVYWRIKQKVKKKKRRTTSNTEDSKSSERGSSFDDRLSNLEAEKTNHDIDQKIPMVNINTVEESKMIEATEVLRETKDKTRPKLCRQNSVEMQQAVEVIRPINLENKNSLLVPDSEDFQHNLVQSEKFQPKNTEQKLESPEKEDKHKENLQTELTQHNIDIVTPYKILSNNLSKDSFWTNKHLIDDAEERFYSMRELVKVSIKVKEMKKDGSDDDDDKKNNDNHEDKRNFSTAPKESFVKDGSDLPDLEHSDFTWTDESTYLNPKIPVLKPITFKMMSLNDSSQIETLVTKQAKSLTEQIKNDITYTFKDEKDSSSLTCTIQVSLESLQSSISQLEETLTTCTSEDLDSQYAVVQYVLKTVNGLETDAKKLEQTLSESRNQDIDFTTLSANLTGCKTQIITIQTLAENLKSKIERHQSDRRKKLNEFKRYQSLLIDLEQWVGEAQSAISTEINLTNVKVVRDQIRASEILQQELLMRAKQLKIMIEEVQQFMPFSEVEPLIIDMRENLGTLHQVLNEAQLTLESKLMNLQVH